MKYWVFVQEQKVRRSTGNSRFLCSWCFIHRLYRTGPDFCCEFGSISKRYRSERKMNEGRCEFYPCSDPLHAEFCLSVLLPFNLGHVFKKYIFLKALRTPMAFSWDSYELVLSSFSLHYLPAARPIYQLTVLRPLCNKRSVPPAWRELFKDFYLCLE